MTSQAGNRRLELEPGNFAAESPRTRGTWQLLNTTLGPFLALCIIWIAFAALDGFQSFAELRSFQLIVVHTAAVAVPALGMTMIIIAGGIDLSVGATMALSATVGAWGFLNGCSPVASIALCLATGLACGVVNGSLISSLRVVPFIVTLGTMMVFQGTGRWIAGDTPIRPPLKSFQSLTSFQSPFPDPAWHLFSPGVWLMLLLALVVSLVLRYAIFGRYIFALGSNEATARLCGIHVPTVRISVYALGGLFAGIAGVYQFATLYQGNPMEGIGKELRIIAAVVVGGGSLNGGRGSVLGTLSGAAIMAVIDHGCSTLSVGDMYQDVLIGVIIVAAVAVDQYRQRRMAER